MAYLKPIFEENLPQLQQYVEERFGLEFGRLRLRPLWEWGMHEIPLKRYKTAPGVDRKAAWMELQGEFAREALVGDLRHCARAGPKTIYYPLARDTPDVDEDAGKVILLHELSHVAAFEYTGHGYLSYMRHIINNPRRPWWVDEGFAGYCGRMFAKERGIPLGTYERFTKNQECTEHFAQMIERLGLEEPVWMLHVAIEYAEDHPEQAREMLK
jgi:hypothetical protein